MLAKPARAKGLGVNNGVTEMPKRNVWLDRALTVAALERNRARDNAFVNVWLGMFDDYRAKANGVTK